MTFHAPETALHPAFADLLAVEAIDFA